MPLVVLRSMLSQFKQWCKQWVLYLVLLLVKPLMMMGLVESDVQLLGQIFEAVLQPLTRKIDVLNERLSEVEKVMSERRGGEKEFKDKDNVNIQPDNQSWDWREKCQSFQEKSGDISNDSIKTDNLPAELPKEDLISLGDITVCGESEGPSEPRTDSRLSEIEPRTHSRISEPGSLDAELLVHEQGLHDFVNKYSSREKDTMSTTTTPSPFEPSRERDRKVKFKKGLRYEPKSICSLGTVSSYHSSSSSKEKILNKDNSFDSYEAGEIRDLITSSSSDQHSDPFDDCGNAPLFKILKKELAKPPPPASASLIHAKSRAQFVDDASFRSISPTSLKTTSLVDLDSNLSCSYLSLVDNNQSKYSVSSEGLATPDSELGVPYVKRKDLEFGVMSFDDKPRTSIPKTPRTLPKISPRISPAPRIKEPDLTKPINVRSAEIPVTDQPSNQEPQSPKLPKKTNKLSRSCHYSTANVSTTPPLIIKPDYNILVGDDLNYVSDSCNEDIRTDHEGHDYTTDELASTGESVRTIRESPAPAPNMAITEEFTFFLQSPFPAEEEEELIEVTPHLAEKDKCQSPVNPEVVIDYAEIPSGPLPSIPERNNSSSDSHHLELPPAPTNDLSCNVKRSIFKHSKSVSQRESDDTKGDIAAKIESFIQRSEDSLVTESSMDKGDLFSVTPMASFLMESFLMESFEHDNPIPAEESIDYSDLELYQEPSVDMEVNITDDEVQGILEYVAPYEETFGPNVDQPFSEDYQIPVNQYSPFEDDFNPALEADVAFEDDFNPSPPVEPETEVQDDNTQPIESVTSQESIYHDIEPQQSLRQNLPPQPEPVKQTSELLNRDPEGLQRVKSLRAMPAEKKKKRARRMSVQNIIQKIETSSPPLKRSDKPPSSPSKRTAISPPLKRGDAESKSIFQKLNASLRKKKKSKEEQPFPSLERPSSCPPIPKSPSTDSLMKIHREVSVTSSGPVVRSGSVSELPIHKPPPGLVKKMKNKIGRKLSFSSKPIKAFSEADISSISPKLKKKGLFRNKSPKFWKSSKTSYSSLSNIDYKADTSSLVSQDSYEFSECIDSTEDEDVNMRSYASAQTNSEGSNWANFEEAFQSRENLPQLSRSRSGSKRSVKSIASIISSTGKPPPSPRVSFKRKTSLPKEKPDHKVSMYAPAVMPQSPQSTVNTPNYLYTPPPDVSSPAPFVIEGYVPQSYVTEVISSSTNTDNEGVEYHTEQYDFSDKDQLAFGSTKADITRNPRPSPQPLRRDLEYSLPQPPRADYNPSPQPPKMDYPSPQLPRAAYQHSAQPARVEYRPAPQPPSADFPLPQPLRVAHYPPRVNYISDEELNPIMTPSLEAAHFSNVDELKDMFTPKRPVVEKPVKGLRRQESEEPVRSPIRGGLKRQKVFTEETVKAPSVRSRAVEPPREMFTSIAEPCYSYSTFNEYGRPVTLVLPASVQQIVTTFESELFASKMKDLAEEINVNTELQKALLDIVQEERSVIKVQRQASLERLKDVRSRTMVSEGKTATLTAKQHTKNAILKLLEDAKYSINIDLSCLEDIEQLSNTHMIDGLLKLVKDKKHHGPRKLFLCTFVSHLLEDMEIGGWQIDAGKIKQAHNETLKQFKTTSDAVEELDKRCADLVADKQDTMVKCLIDSLLAVTFSRIKEESKKEKYKKIVLRELLRRDFSMKLKRFKEDKFRASVCIRDMLRLHLETKLSEIRLNKPSIGFTRTKTKVYKNKTKKIEEFRNNFVIKMCLSNTFSTMSKAHRRRIASKKYHFQHLCQSMLQNIITENQFSELVTCTVQDCLSKYLFLKLQAIRKRSPSSKSKKSPTKLLPFYKHQFEGLSETVERVCYSPIQEHIPQRQDTITSSPYCQRQETLTSSRSSQYCQTEQTTDRPTHLADLATQSSLDLSSGVSLDWNSRLQSSPTKEHRDLATQSSINLCEWSVREEGSSPTKELRDLATQSSFEADYHLREASRFYERATQSSFEAPKHLADLATQSSFEHDQVSNSLTSILTQTDFGIAEEFQPFKHTRALLNSRRSKSLDSALGDDSIVSELSLEKLLDGGIKEENPKGI